MKGIRFLAAIAACLMVAVAMADDTDEAKKKINSIKKNSSYLYAEVTAATADEARSLAEEILYTEINEWAAGQKKLRNSPGLAVNNKQTLWTTMSLPRGNMFRSFIYVKKSDILPVANSEVIANPAAAEDRQATGEEAQPGLVSTVAPVVPEAVAELMKYADYKPMAERIMRMKAEGKVASYGYYAQLPNPEACYLAIYSREGKLVAFLSPGRERVNLATGKPDKVANYSVHGAVGFIANE